MKAALAMLTLVYWPWVAIQAVKNHEVPYVLIETAAEELVGHTVTATAYSSTTGQTDSTPHQTASGTHPKRGTMAVSRDLLKEFPYGTKVRMGGVEYTVEDTMHRRWTSRVDIWCEKREEALRFGKRQMKLVPIRN